MRSSLLAVVATATAALLGSVVAVEQNHGRRHAHEDYHRGLKRSGGLEMRDDANASCGCTTYVSTWYGEPTMVYAAPPPPPTTSTTTHTTTSTTPPPPPPPTTTSVKTTAAAATTAPAPKTSASTSTPIVSSGNKWAVAYTPYDTAGLCKSSSQVSSDVAAIKGKGFSTVRIYGTDCSGLVNVGNACKANGLKLIVGVFISGGGIPGAQSEVSDITTYFHGDYSIVELVLVGNEAISQGHCDAGSLASFIDSTRSTLRAAGYQGPVSTAETIGQLQQSDGVLCSHMDVMAANIHPFFNSQVSPVSAGMFVASQLQILEAMCGGSKPAFCTETGWPSGGDSNGAAVPGESEQQKALEAIMGQVGPKVAMFSFQDDAWKAPGPLGVEQKWGCFSLL